MAAPEARGSERKGGDEAVCFTAGPRGAAFGAGVIHAWLASDRKAPLVVAGISTGALSSAAMRRAYRELETAADGPPTRLEPARWTWFRRYLDAITNDPLGFVWRSIPDPVDFFAEQPPVADKSVRDLPQDMGGTVPSAGVSDATDKVSEADARRHYFLLTKLGIWLARLPLQVRTVARIAVHYVRWREGYARPAYQRAAFCAHLAVAGITLWWHVATAPTFLSERSFGHNRWRPLFGWRVWLISLLPFAIAACIIAAKWSWLWLVPAVAMPLGVAVWARRQSKNSESQLNWWLFTQLAAPLDLSKGLLHPFELKRKLYELFEQETVGAGVEGTDLMIVCAALEQTLQVWPKPEVRVIDAVAAALAVPGVFPPVCFRKGQLDTHRRLKDPDNGWRDEDKALLIDGNAVRSNPVPALFTWCQQNSLRARRLERPLDDLSRTLHVVYSVPIDAEQDRSMEQIDIVESALSALELEQRRDTRQEVRQTNFLSKLEHYRRLANPNQPRRFRLFADEIAPETAVDYQNEWDPSRDEMLQVAAHGCRQSLQVLYRTEISSLLQDGETDVACSALLRVVAPRRRQHLNGNCSGLPEICDRCSGRLVATAERDADALPVGVRQSYGQPAAVPVTPETLFPHLNGDQPRIAFLGSGGVFRGAFHIGVIGALQATRAYPDLVVGASVGALMGGALATISVSGDEWEERELLSRLCTTFLAVDEQVALTRTLKNAMKQLGTRAAEVRLSPAAVREMVIEGASADSGFAATGAPPALIDAISQLFLIPHRETTDIASDFVGNNFTRATNNFLTAVRRYTLENLQVRCSFMGTSLLKTVAEALLGAQQIDLSEVQPYHRPASKKAPVSFFCTTTFLNARTSLLLGRDFLTEDPSWNMVEAALSSAAFPAVFSPRSEAQVLPGRGRTDRLFADGGMFDNLPIFPAIEVMGDCQSAGRSKDLSDVLGRLAARKDRPDVIIAAGLDALPDSNRNFDTIARIRKRAQSLSVASKIETFVAVAKQTNEAVQDIAAHATELRAALSKEQAAAAAHYLDSVVCARIVKIVPTDRQHINPTFAFCKSAGLEKDRVCRSIGDGCFRTMMQLHNEVRRPDSMVTAAFGKKRDTPIRVGELRVVPETGARETLCPYFVVAGGRLPCPFAQSAEADVRAVRSVCAADAAHIAQAATAAQRSETSPPPAPQVSKQVSAN